MPNAFPEALQGLLRGLERAQEHLVITDANGVIVYANQAAEKHTGYRIEEMLGNKPGDLWGGHMPPEFYTDMWETISVHKQAFIGDMWNRHKSGRMYWQEVHIIPILDSQDVVRYLIGIELSVDDPERRDQILRECVASADLNEASLRIQWPLGWLFEAHSLSPDQARQLQAYYSDEEAVNALVADLMFLSNVPYAAKEPVESFCLFALVKSVAGAIREQYPDRSFAFEYPEPSGTCPVTENRRLVEDALRRLVANAAQYTPPETGQVTVHLLRTPTACIVRVQDNGIGISPEEQRHIFSKFYRGTKARNLHPAGSGLGLYVVRAVCEARGWSIGWISGTGTGACFELKIPLKEEGV